MTTIFIANWSYGDAADALNDDRDVSVDDLARPAFSHVFTEWTKKQEATVKAAVQEYIDECPLREPGPIEWTYHGSNEADVIHFLGLHPDWGEETLKITVIKLTADEHGNFTYI